jgi:phosphatidylglycerol---prolipoprotein diacylglyceryl transferase
MMSIRLFNSINISYYALCILLGAFVTYLLIRREWQYKGFKMDDLNDAFFNTLLVGIIGARIWYVLFNLNAYMSNPLKMLAIWEGGLAIHGGLIAGTLYGYYYFKKRNYDFLDVADTVMPYVLIAQAFGRWGNFFNHEAYGSQVTRGYLESLHLPKFIIDNMHINGGYYHPTFLYESIYCLIAFIIIRLIIKYIPLKVGQSALLYVILYSIGRFFIEGLRMDSLMFFGLKTAQLVSIIAIIAGIIMYIMLNKTQAQNSLQVRRMNDGKK